tara:strand:+ start:316 stop:483 length:168 start_codon:yes stop_codon:yes gene_type:complete
MGPFEKLDNIKNLINKPLDNKTIRNTKELEDFNTTGDPDYSYYDLGEAEKQQKTK